MKLEVLPGLLLPWYRENRRELPWRQTSDPYRIWVSEIMLQQTRVEAVKGYYARFLDRLPDIAALAKDPGALSHLGVGDHAPADPGGGGEGLLCPFFGAAAGHREPGPL